MTDTNNETKISDFARATVDASTDASGRGTATGARKAFNAEKQEKLAEKRMAKIVTDATMIAAGVIPGNSRFADRKAARAWLEATCERYVSPEDFAAQNAAE